MTRPDQTLSLTVIGAGHLGRVLARLWHAQGYFRIQDILTRSIGSANDAAQWIGAGAPQADVSHLRPADVFLIATPDDQIAAVCQQLRQAGLLHSSSVVFHCSGALPSSVLRDEAGGGTAIASIHPIRSFAQPQQLLSSFAGTWCGAEGDEQALAVLRPAFEAIGAQLVPIRANDKTLYHAAAVFASNYLVTVMDAAVQLYQAAGVPSATALQLMQPLVRSTLDNVFEVGPVDALSGPIARGDLATVERQAMALAAHHPELAALYEALVKATVQLAKRKKPRGA